MIVVGIDMVTHDIVLLSFGVQFQPLENIYFIFNIKVIINTIQGQKKIEKNPKTRIHEDDEGMIIITFLICLSRN
jgi:hypothetical protein